MCVHIQAWIDWSDGTVHKAKAEKCFHFHSMTTDRIPFDVPLCIHWNSLFLAHSPIRSTRMCNITRICITFQFIGISVTKFDEFDSSWHYNVPPANDIWSNPFKWSANQIQWVFVSAQTMNSTIVSTMTIDYFVTWNWNFVIQMDTLENCANLQLTHSIIEKMKNKHHQTVLLTHLPFGIIFKCFTFKLI